MIRHVQQEDSYGCGPACLAMITGRSYREVRDWFQVRAWQNAHHDGRYEAIKDDESAYNAIEPHDFTRHGITEFEIRRYLAEHGYATAQRHPTAQVFGADRPWPCAPFAPAHILCVQSVDGGHYIVLTADGRVLDPADPQVTALDDPRYGTRGSWTLYMIGVVPLPDTVAA